MRVNYSKLANALGLSIDQLESVEDVHKTFCIEMMNAANAPKDERKSMVDKAIEKNLKYMRYILNSNQYSKYLQLLNATMNNRGTSGKTDMQFFVCIPLLKEALLWFLCGKILRSAFRFFRQYLLIHDKIKSLFELILLV